MSTSADLPVYPVLLAGGSGSRLWPVSRELHPKQIAKFIGKESLIQSTLRRLVPPFAAENVRVVCGEPHLHEIGRHMEDIGISPAGRIICEPVGRNTAPAILLAVTRILETAADAIIGVFPADHVIGNPADFPRPAGGRGRFGRPGSHRHLRDHAPLSGNRLRLCGGRRKGAGRRRRTRSPALCRKAGPRTAHRYLDAGNFFWNSGMFAFRASVILEEFRLHQPRMLQTLQRICIPGLPLRREDYQTVPDLSIDIAIMEKTAGASSCPRSSAGATSVHGNRSTISCPRTRTATCSTAM